MTRKHFQAIAAALREERPDAADVDAFDRTPWEAGTYDEWSTVVIRIASTLSNLAGNDINGNRRFKRDRFLAACGFAS